MEEGVAPCQPFFEGIPVAQVAFAKLDVESVEVAPVGAGANESPDVVPFAKEQPVTRLAPMKPVAPVTNTFIAN